MFLCLKMKVQNDKLKMQFKLSTVDHRIQLKSKCLLNVKKSIVFCQTNGSTQDQGTLCSGFVCSIIKRCSMRSQLNHWRLESYYRVQPEGSRLRAGFGKERRGQRGFLLLCLFCPSLFPPLSLFLFVGRLVLPFGPGSVRPFPSLRPHYQSLSSPLRPPPLPLYACAVYDKQLNAFFLTPQSKCASPRKLRTRTPSYNNCITVKPVLPINKCIRKILAPPKFQRFFGVFH